MDPQKQIAFFRKIHEEINTVAMEHLRESLPVALDEIKHELEPFLVVQHSIKKAIKKLDKLDKAYE